MRSGDEQSGAFVSAEVLDGGADEIGCDPDAIYEHLGLLLGERASKIRSAGEIDEAAIDAHRVHAQDLQQRIVQAEAGLGKPFKYTAELQAAEDRYSEITATMADDQNEPVLVQAETAAGPTSTAHAVRVSGLLAEARAKLAEPARPAFTSSQPRPDRNPQPDPDRGIARE